MSLDSEYFDTPGYHRVDGVDVKDKPDVVDMSMYNTDLDDYDTEYKSREFDISKNIKVRPDRQPEDKLWPTIEISLRDIVPSRIEKHISYVKNILTKHYNFDFQLNYDEEYQDSDTYYIEMKFPVDKIDVKKMMRHATFREKKVRKFFPTAHYLHLDKLDINVVFNDSDDRLFDIGSMRENKIIKVNGMEVKYATVILEKNVKINKNVILHKGISIRVYEEIPLQGTFGFEGEPDWVENRYLPEMTSEERVEKTLEMLEQKAEWITDYVKNNADYANGYSSFPP